jgi:hypothetical protein
MKKFSSVINTKISEEPKSPELTKEEKRIELLRAKLMKLMDDFLKIQSSGSARAELVNSAVTITGKEILTDAIIDLISDEFDEEKINLLESLKYEIGDWYVIDNKISQINENIIGEKNKKEVNLEKKLVTFFELYSDEKDFDVIAEKYVSKIKKNKDIKERMLMTESILLNEKYSRIKKDKVKILLGKFKKRYND